MKRMKILVLSLILVFLASILATPVHACTTTKIPFTLTLYLVGGTPPTKTWSSPNGEILYSTGGTSTLKTLDGTLVSEITTVLAMTNTATGMVYAISTFVDTYTGGIIGTGVIKGTIVGTANIATETGTNSNIGQGNSNLYQHITELSTTSFEIVSTPFPALAFTITGVFICQE